MKTKRPWYEDSLRQSYLTNENYLTQDEEQEGKKDFFFFKSCSVHSFAK